MKRGFSMVIVQSIGAALLGVYRYRGRSDRVEQWSFSLFTAVLALTHWHMARAGLIPHGEARLALGAMWVWIGAAHVALMVRRLHDHGRSGVFVTSPAIGLCIALLGHLGEAGSLGIDGTAAQLMRAYGWVLERAGWMLMLLAFSMLAAVFVGEGDPDENEYGDPI